jgi:uroporphyrinogen-III synthase
MATSPGIVLTRERERNRPWAERLRAAGHAVREMPLLRFTPLDPPGDYDVADFDWIMFTSPQGVRAFHGAGLRPGMARIVTLGPGTAAALDEFGWTDALGLRCRDGVELAQAFLATVAGPARVLLPGPARRGSEPRASLMTAGFEVRELPLYVTAPVPAADLPENPCGPDEIVFFCSPSTVKAFAGRWDARPRCVAIGRPTAETATLAGFPVAVADRPDLESMVRAAGLDPLPVTATPECES